MTLVLTPLTGVPEIHPGDYLGEIILFCLENTRLSLENGDVLVLAQKIISKAENRFVNLTHIEPTPEAYDLAEKSSKDPQVAELILRESRSILRVKPGTIIVEHRLGFVCANAGIDHSNVMSLTNHNDRFVLCLPLDPDKSANNIREYIENVSGKKIGVLIIDSHGRAWRLGTVGTAIGISGVPALVDLRGKPDMYGGELQTTEVGAADELAGGASLVMGQADERTPVVHVRGFPYQLREAKINEIIRPEELDLFR